MHVVALVVGSLGRVEHEPVVAHLLLGDTFLAHVVLVALFLVLVLAVLGRALKTGSWKTWSKSIYRRGRMWWRPAYITVAEER